MKTLKYLIVMVAITTSLSSCFVRGGHGYGHGHEHGRGY
jgi:hypothetical protein